jgi:hypothetical protein
MIEHTKVTAGIVSTPRLGVRAPIALFVYNRPLHTRQTIEALQKNELAEESDLFIFSDAPKSIEVESGVREVRTYVGDIIGFKSVTVFEKAENWGVDPSIIDGVTMLCERYGQVIVLEDDLLTSRWFLKYMNRALDLYRDEESVMQIAGFMFPISDFDDKHACFLPFTSSWGWATWKRAWNCFDPSAAGYETLKKDKRKRHAFDLNGAYDYFEMLKQYIDGKLDAWDIRWYLSVFLKNGLTLFPQKSLVNNIGFDGSGVHCPASDFAESEISQIEVQHFPSVERDAAIGQSVEAYLYRKRERSIRPFIKRVLGW